MDRKTFVIGGGFTGLYYAFRDNNATVLSDKKDLVAKTFKKSDDSYIFLRYHLSTKRLLDELKISYTLKDFTISYYYQNRQHKYPTIEAIQNYYMKAYGVPPVNIFSGYDTNKYKVFSLVYSELIQALVEKIGDRIIYEKATGIITKDKIVTVEREMFNYDRLMSTIPLPITCYLANNKELVELSKKLEAVPIGIYFNPEIPNVERKTNQILNMEPSSEILRWVKPLNSDEYTSECLIKSTTAEGAKKSPDIFLKYGKIIPSESTQSIIRRLEGMDIVPIGRFATWTPHFDTEDAIKTIDYMLNNR